jgi:hypothetical protein
MSTNQSYQPYQWLYPGNYQPLQSVSVLLVDLFNHPSAAETVESRRLLDSAFALIGPDGRVSASGCEGSTYTSHQDVWQRLENLRRKVWAKLGLDYSMHWGQSFDRKDQPRDTLSDLGYIESNL